MFCREVKATISPYLDGELDNRQSRLLEDHIASCPNCRARLGLLEELPTVLHTDRILAPRPEFTRVVMQQVIIRQQIGVLLTKNDPNSVSKPTTTAFQASTPATRASLAPNLTRPARSFKPTSAYVLRFSAMAAALVVVISVGVFTLAQSPGQLSDTSAAVYGAVQGFADTLRSALSNPLELVVGLLVAAVIMFGLWYYLARPNTSRRS